MPPKPQASLEHFHPAKRKPHPHKQSTQSSQPLATAHLHAISKDLLVLGISCKYNHMMPLYVLPRAACGRMLD